MKCPICGLEYYTAGGGKHIGCPGDKSPDKKPKARDERKKTGQVTEGIGESTSDPEKKTFSGNGIEGRK